MAAPKRPAGNAGKGRPRGSRNKVTRELKQIAQEYTEEAVAALAAVIRDPESPAATRIAAATDLLDRGHGKPHQQIEDSRDAPAVDEEAAAAEAREIIMAKLERLAAAAAAAEKSEYRN